MSREFKFNSLAIILLAVWFYFFFMAAKHDPTLSAVSSFTEDPYDAIGSFGIQAAMFLGILSLIRAFRAYPKEAPLEEQKVFLARTQILAILAVVVTLAGDCVAIVRYTHVWIGSPGEGELAMFLGGLVFFAIVLGVLVYRAAEKINLTAKPKRWTRSISVFLGTTFILAIYPDSFRQNTFGALSTVIVGATLLFVQMWAFGMSIVSYQTMPQQDEAVTPYNWVKRRKYSLSFVALLGVLMGSFFVLGQSTEGGGGPHLTGLAFIASVYISLETAGLFIGYGFLRNSLGLPQ